MVSGRPPFTAEGVGELFAKHMLEDPPPGHRVRAQRAPAHGGRDHEGARQGPGRALRRAWRNSARRSWARSRWRCRPRRAGPHRGFSNPQAMRRRCRRARRRRCRRRQLRDRRIVRHGAEAATKLCSGRWAAARRCWRWATSLLFGKDKAPRRGPQAVVATTTARCAVTPPTPPAPAGEEDRHHPLRGRACGRARVPQEGQQGPGRRARRGAARQGRGQGGPDALAYVLRLPGYRERPLVADAATDRTFHVSLEKAPAAAGRRQEGQRTGGHRAVGRPRNPVDEDGLATPSF